MAGTAYQFWSAQTEEFVDLLKAGILNAPKVARTALQDITSVAGLLVTPRLWWPSYRRRRPLPPCP